MPENKLRNYRSARGAHAYKADYANKVHRKLSDRRERRIFDRYFARIGRSATILDIPCGAGRLLGLLRRHADEVIEADYSESMLALNAADHGGDRYLQCSALAIPLTDRSVSTVVSVRLSHHFDHATDRERHLRELFRVANRHVIVSWFDHHSLKNRLRQLRRPFNRKRPKNTLRAARVRTIARSCGYSTIAITPLSRLGSGHAFGLFER